jgi:3-oxoadipate enol-lactonase
MNVAHVVDGPVARPVLVLSSSLGTTWELWDAQLVELARHFRVLRYDHPGHGRSEAPPGPITIEALAGGLVELLDRLELERVSFCGLSLGGMVGMALALEAPERVDRLVLCCTAAYLGPAEGWHDRARLVRAGGTAAIAERVLERWFTERLRTERPAVVSRFREMLQATPREGYAACCEAIASWDARTSLGAIRAPTLVIAGEEDVATPPDDAVFLEGAIPGAGLVVLPGAAHLANVEQPELFNRALLGHFSAPSSSEEVAA